jgi:hypothetical protein
MPSGNPNAVIENDDLKQPFEIEFLGRQRSQRFEISCEMSP